MQGPLEREVDLAVLRTEQAESGGARRPLPASDHAQVPAMPIGKADPHWDDIDRDDPTTPASAQVPL